MRSLASMKNLVHTSTPFEAVVCLNGVLPAVGVFEQFADRPLIAADGAASALVGMGIVPEYVVGDFDSIDRSILDSVRTTSEVIVDLDQDITDFEKALRLARTMLYGRLLVLGIHGGDMDHTLNNWSVFMRHSREFPLVALDNNRYAIPLAEGFVYHSRANELISLIPQPKAALTTTGLVWELNAEELALGVREGARNRSTGTQVTVDIHSGSILFVCEACIPSAPELTEQVIFEAPINVKPRNYDA